MFESTKIIGQRQFDKARQLFESAQLQIKGPIGFVHQYVNMTNVVLQTNKGPVTTCKAAMGYSFAAGTTDGNRNTLLRLLTYFPHQDRVHLTFRKEQQGQPHFGTWSVIS